MTDQHLRASVREWTDLLARCRFGTVKVAGKNISSSKIKEVAGRLATYADSDGSRVRPGLARIAVDLEIDPGTAKRAVQHLARIGLLKLIRAGARPGHADEYHLTIPVDLVEHVEVWSPARHTLEVERVREGMRGRYKPKPAGEPDPDPEPDLLVPQTPADSRDLLVPGGPAQPVDNPGLLVPDAPAEPAHTAGPAGPVGTDIPGPAGPVGTDLLVPQGPATYHGPRHNPDRPTDTALRTAVTVDDHPQAAQDPLFPVVDEGPKPCPHGLGATIRCPACRRGLDTTPPPVTPLLDLRNVPFVWIATARKGIDYHRPTAIPGDVMGMTGCGRSMHTGTQLAEDVAQHAYEAKPCPRCWPPAATELRSAS